MTSAASVPETASAVSTAPSRSSSTTALTTTGSTAASSANTTTATSAGGTAPSTTGTAGSQASATAAVDPAKSAFSKWYTDNASKISRYLSSTPSATDIQVSRNRPNEDDSLIGRSEGYCPSFSGNGVKKYKDEKGRDVTVFQFDCTRRTGEIELEAGGTKAKITWAPAEGDKNKFTLDTKAGGDAIDGTRDSIPTIIRPDPRPFTVTKKPTQPKAPSWYSALDRATLVKAPDKKPLKWGWSPYMFKDAKEAKKSQCDASERWTAPILSAAEESGIALPPFENVLMASWAMHDASDIPSELASAAMTTLRTLGHVDEATKERFVKTLETNIANELDNPAPIPTTYQGLDPWTSALTLMDGDKASAVQLKTTLAGRYFAANELRYHLYSINGTDHMDGKTCTWDEMTKAAHWGVNTVHKHGIREDTVLDFIVDQFKKGERLPDECPESLKTTGRVTRTDGIETGKFASSRGPLPTWTLADRSTAASSGEGFEISGSSLDRFSRIKKDLSPVLAGLAKSLGTRVSTEG